MSKKRLFTMVIVSLLFAAWNSTSFAQCNNRSGSSSNAASGYSQLAFAPNTAYGQLPSRQSGYPGFAGNAGYNQNALAQMYRNQQAFQSRAAAIQYQQQVALARNAQLRSLRAQRRSSATAPESIEQTTDSLDGKLASTSGTSSKSTDSLELLPK